jgi:hypothetical protein
MSGFESFSIIKFHIRNNIAKCFEKKKNTYIHDLVCYLFFICYCEYYEDSNMKGHITAKKEKDENEEEE